MRSFAARGSGETCLVGDGLSIATALGSGAQGSRTRPESRTSNAKGVHDGWRSQLSARRRRGHWSFVVRADLAADPNSLSRDCPDKLAEECLCGEAPRPG